MKLLGIMFIPGWKPADVFGFHAGRIPLPGACRKKTPPFKAGWKFASSIRRQQETFLPERKKNLHSGTADAKFIGKLKIFGMIFLCQITQETFPAIHQGHQTASAAVIFFVAAHVFSDFRDTGRKKSNLDFGRTDVAFFAGILADNFRFFCFFHDSFIS